MFLVYQNNIAVPKIRITLLVKEVDVGMLSVILTELD
jgi:hypothetical protein